MHTLQKNSFQKSRGISGSYRLFCYSTKSSYVCCNFRIKTYLFGQFLRYIKTYLLRILDQCPLLGCYYEEFSTVVNSGLYQVPLIRVSCGGFRIETFPLFIYGSRAFSFLCLGMFLFILVLFSYRTFSTVSYSVQTSQRIDHKINMTPISGTNTLVGKAIGLRKQPIGRTIFHIARDGQQNQNNISSKLTTRILFVIA